MEWEQAGCGGVGGYRWRRARRRWCWTWRGVRRSRWGARPWTCARAWRRRAPWAAPARAARPTSAARRPAPPGSSFYVNPFTLHFTHPSLSTLFYVFSLCGTEFRSCETVDMMIYLFILTEQPRITRYCPASVIIPRYVIQLEFKMSTWKCSKQKYLSMNRCCSCGLWYRRRQRRGGPHREVGVLVQLAAGEARQLAQRGAVHVGVVAHEQLHAHARRRAQLAQLVVRRRLGRCRQPLPTHLLFYEPLNILGEWKMAMLYSCCHEHLWHPLLWNQYNNLKSTDN